MANMAEFIARRWPGTPDADTAFGVLVSYAIRNNRIDDAERLVAEASDQSRPRLELQLGNAMWGRYLELSQARRWRRSGRRIARTSTSNRPWPNYAADSSKPPQRIT